MVSLWGSRVVFSIAPQALPMASVATGNYRGGISYAMGVDSMDAGYNSPEVEVREIARKYFPETWIWDMVPLE